MNGGTDKTPFYTAGSGNSGRKWSGTPAIGAVEHRAASTRARGFVLGATAIAFLLPNCVNLSPPWQAGTGGTTVVGTGGSSSGGNRDDGGALDSNVGDAPLPNQPDAEDDVSQQGPDSPADVSGMDADARIDGRDAAPLDADSDRPALGGSGGSPSRGGAGGRGDSTGSGGSGSGGSGSGGTAAGGTSSGGQTGTGGSGTGGAPAIDAGSVCVGRPGSDAGTGINAGLIAYYACDQTSGPMLTDQSGNSNNGTLVTGTGGTPGYSFGAGKVGTGALDLVAASHGYATLPSCLLADTCDVTIASWVYVNVSANWQRVFDFGKDTNVYMFLAATNNLTSVVRFAITLGSMGGEQKMDGQAELPVKAWSHVAIVLGDSGATLYVNGSSVGSNPNIVLRPADLGTPLNYYIGRSQFAADPYFDGNIDDFRIYGRALSASEIQTLAKM